MSETPKPKIFISYAHDDREACDTLLNFLGWARHSGQVEVFDDKQLKPGSNWDETLKAKLEGADIIICLVSDKFIGSKYCTLIEMKGALTGQALVIPVVLTTVPFATLPLAERQALPKDNKQKLKPIDLWRGTAQRNIAWTQVAEAIQDAIATTPAQPGLDEAGATFIHYPPLPKLNNLPRRNSDWTGREGDVERLMAALRQGGTASVCSVGGMGGIGKSTLAFEAAHRLGSQDFADGILQFDLKGIEAEPLDAYELMSKLLLAIEPEQKLPEDVSGLYQQVLRGRKMLLILDNAKDQSQAAPMLPPDPVAVLITSRNEIEPPNGTLINLDLMPPCEAVDLLKKELGGMAQHIDLAKLAELCGFLPLALSVTAGSIRKSRVRTAASIMTELEKNPGREMAAVLARLASSLDVLEADDAELYGHYLTLSIMPSRFTVEAAAAVMGMDGRAAGAALEELIARSLVMPAGDGGADVAGGELRFRLHDLLKQAAGGRLDDAVRHAASLRHAGWWRDVLLQSRRLMDEGGDKTLAALRLFDSERGHIEAGQRWLAEHWE